MTADNPLPIAIGRFSGVFGVRGWLRVLSYTRPAANIVDYRPWFLLDGGTLAPIQIAETDWRGHVLVARIAGIDVREEAATWVGREIFITREQLPPPGPGDIYWADLIGLNVVNRSGVVLGEVTRLLETGAHDVLVVRGDQERLIPFVRGVHVLDIDMVARRVTVDWEADY
jgi:16S rRNA processing protein RimM